MTQFAMGDYVDVATRVAEFRTKFPDGSLQPADIAKPYSIEELGGQTYIVVVAAAYRSADDQRPGIGMAGEQFPGRTPYTRGSELQNAETSAWGRAIVAALAADTRKGVSSAEEVRNRREEQDNPLPEETRRAPQRQAQRAQAQPDQPELSKDELAAIALHDVDAWLTVDKAGVAKLWKDSKDSPCANMDVSGLLTDEDREVLGIAEGEPMALVALATKAGQYATKFGRPVRAPLDAVA